jgi:hypothetical protein
VDDGTYPSVVKMHEIYLRPKGIGSKSNQFTVTVEIVSTKLSSYFSRQRERKKIGLAPNSFL